MTPTVTLLMSLLTSLPTEVDAISRAFATVRSALSATDQATIAAILSALDQRTDQDVLRLDADATASAPASAPT